MYTTFPGACDCHVHIYEDGYPVVPNAAWLPRHSPVSAYRSEVQAQVGLQRAIVVQPTGYGFDNRCTLAALAQLGDSARGIAVVAPDAPDAEIARLHAAGVRGVRFMMLPPSVMAWDSLEPMAARLKDVGWMVNLQLDGRTMPGHEAALKRLPCKLVIDHIGKFLEPVAPEHPAFQSLLRVLDTGNAWIKLSAPYETSKTGAPGYDDVSLLARSLAVQFPERCLWASNWPHPGRDPVPPVVPLYDLLAAWAGSEATRRRILVDNPAQLYGF
ncbi:amidohydrolase [Variovorax sp. dw_308]|uniref:amidohydrolase family protein n=1 Tax=Variovorax sp. dw_308 TaxID=2721546 RepID=UPI001C48BA22|nr:amidohydrolase family protein [Variovorax sp. dw_308]